MKTLRLALAACIFLEFIFAPSLRAETLPYSLVDKDKYAIFEEEQAAKRERELAIEEPPDDAQLLKYSNEFWRQAVTAVEGAYKLDKEPEPIPDLTLLNPTLSLPLYGTSIALTGRYVLGFQLSAKKYKEDPNNDITERNTSSMEMLQEMQLKMQGKILERVFVDIDYDDQREEEKTISVAYRGKPGELVQVAEFGDINLSLPQTEFIAYQKQLFGAKMQLQYKNANLYLIGSQTKGSSKQKQFIGSSVLEIVSIADTNYTRRTYYDLTFGGNIKPNPSGQYSLNREAYDDYWSKQIISISPGSEEIYIDANTTSNDFVPITKTATDLLGGGDYTAKWRLMQRGVDYTVDYSRGIIEFKSALSAASVVAVDYRDSMGRLLSEVLGTPGTIKLIKTENEKSVTGAATETANRLEMKTFYSVGAQQITRDNGKGNFILQMLDANGQTLAINAYPSGTLSYPGKIEMDFDKGVFELQNRLPDASLYQATPVSTGNRTFKIEYTSTVKTYFIESDIVLQSETVKLNGRTLTRNNDYYIDYTSGFITFYKGDEITENSVIDISYDTISGSSSNNTVMGGRLDYQLFDKVKLGATLLQETSDKPSTVPQVGNYSKDLTVYGADVSGRDIKLSDKLSVDFSAEAAHSEKNQNLFGYAMVDSMNETSQQTGGSMVFREWILAANPNNQPGFWGSLGWDTQELPALEINPNSLGTYNDKQQVLVINYDFTRGVNFDGRDELSLVYPLSASGVDLSDKTSFELTMMGNGAGPAVNFTFSNINEDSDNSGGMDTQCGTGVPKTEDVLCRQSLAPNEDIGWEYKDPDGTLHRYNPFVNNAFNPESQPNGRIDTQDLNGNGKFDPEDLGVGGNFGFVSSVPGMAARNTPIEDLPDGVINYSGWKTFVTPLNISAADKQNWTAVRHLRITLKATDAMKASGQLKGQIKIAGVALSGTAWNTQEGNDPDVFSVSGINNVDNSSYVPIFSPNSGDGLEVFNYLYGSVDNLKKATDSVNAKDQALNIRFDTVSLAQVPDGDESAASAGEVYANRNFSTMDFSQHRELRFLLHSEASNAGSEFFLKVGTDVNYDKVIVPTDFDGWRLVSLRMTDTDGDGIADAFENVSDPAYNVRVDRRRAPGGIMNFKKISMILAGMQKGEGQSGSSGEVWLNVIHLAQAIKLEGDAYKGDVDVRLDGWGSAGAKYKHMDSNFETPLTVAKNQEVTEEEYYLKVDKVKEFPVQANFTRSSVVTPNIADSTDYNTVSMLDKGKVERERATVRGDFIKEKLPRVGVEYTLDAVEYDLMKRKDDAQTYGVSVTHDTPRFKSISAGYYITRSTIEYEKSMHAVSENNYNTDETTQRFNAKVNYQPNNKFNFVPSYSLSKSKEERTRYNADSTAYDKYPKAMSQNTGFTSTWKIASWLAPGVSYNISTIENNNLTAKTLSRSGQSVDVGVGDVKTINRNADGGVSLTLNGNELFPKSKLFSSLVVSSSYRMQDADAWADVDSGFDSRKELWIRGSMKDTGRFGYRKSLILRDTFTSSQRWSPLSKYELTGVAAPLKTVSIINNFNKTLQTNDQTGTRYDSESMTLPDMVVSISDLEKFFYGGSWFNASNLKLRYSWLEQTNLGTDKTLTEQYGADLRFMLFNSFDTVVNFTRKQADKTDLRLGGSLERVEDNDWSFQTSFYIKSLRVTPKVLYSSHDRWLVNGQLNESTEELTPSLNLRWDFNLPHGIKLPFINRMYTATNRVIWNTNISYKDKTSPVEVKENYKLWDFSTSLDYELSQNLRFNLSGGVQLLDHAYVATEDYTSYNLAANVTVQF